MSIKAILVDLDGVNWDSKVLHYNSLNAALAGYGYTITPEEQASTFEGLPTLKKLSILTDTKGLPKASHASINALKQVFTAQMMQSSIQPNKRLIEAYKGLKADGYKLALCSNSIRKTVDMFLDKSELRPYFDLTMSNEDVIYPKPSPDMYLRAMERLGVKPEETLILEDSPIGLKSARDSGAHVAVVNSPSDVCLEFIKDAINAVVAK